MGYSSFSFFLETVPICRYSTDASIGLQQQVTHQATYGSEFDADRGVLRHDIGRRANLGATTLSATAASRR